MRKLFIGLAVSWILHVSAECENNGMCNKEGTASCDESSCTCHPGFSDDSCSTFDYQIECDQTYVKVSTKLEYFTRLASISAASDLHLNAAECTGVEKNENGESSLVFMISESPASCGATVESNGTYIKYSNYIRENTITNDPTLVTRSAVQIGFHCLFPVDYRVALPAVIPTVSTVAWQTSRGKFVVKMNMFNDETFTSTLNPGSNEITIAKGEWLYLQMDLMNIIDDAASSLKAEQCWATPVQHQLQDGTEAFHNILQAGCPVDTSVKILSNGENKKVHIKVQMFGFKDQQEQQEVWLHCVVRVCGEGTCRQQCGGLAKRSTAEQGEFSDIAVVTSPKIRITDQDAVEVDVLPEMKELIGDSMDATLVYILSAILILVVLAIFFAAILIHQNSRVSLLDAESNDSPVKKSGNANAGTAFSSVFRG